MSPMTRRELMGRLSVASAAGLQPGLTRRSDSAPKRVAAIATHCSQYLSLQLKARMEGIPTSVYGLGPLHHTGAAPSEMGINNPISGNAGGLLNKTDISEIMARLESLGSAEVRERNARNNAGNNQFGVKMGDIRQLAREIKLNPALAAELWATGNVDARFLATLLMRPKELSADEVERMVLEATYPWLADWLNSYVVKSHPLKEQFRQKWMDSDQVMTARAGWSLTAERIAKNPEGLHLSALLDRIEKEMVSAPALVQWTMNYCLAEIGIHFADHRERAIAMGHKLGVFRDYPTSKGCTSPFAPIWIAEMVKRVQS